MSFPWYNIYIKKLFGVIVEEKFNKNGNLGEELVKSRRFKNNERGAVRARKPFDPIFVKKKKELVSKIRLAIAAC